MPRGFEPKKAQPESDCNGTVFTLLIEAEYVLKCEGAGGNPVFSEFFSFWIRVDKRVSQEAPFLCDLLRGLVFAKFGVCNIA